MSSDRAGASQLSWWVIVLHHRKGRADSRSRDTCSLFWWFLPASGQLWHMSAVLTHWGIRNIGLSRQKGVECLSELGALEVGTLAH